MALTVNSSQTKHSNLASIIKDRLRANNVVADAERPEKTKKSKKELLTISANREEVTTCVEENVDINRVIGSKKETSNINKKSKTSLPVKKRKKERSSSGQETLINSQSMELEVEEKQVECGKKRGRPIKHQANKGVRGKQDDVLGITSEVQKYGITAQLAAAMADTQDGVAILAKDARVHASEALKTIRSIMNRTANRPADRLAAAAMILDRAYGKTSTGSIHDNTVIAPIIVVPSFQLLGPVVENTLLDCTRPPADQRELAEVKDVGTITLDVPYAERVYGDDDDGKPMN
jgi:hypothetical protein